MTSILLTGASGFIGSYIRHSDLVSRLVVRNNLDCIKSEYFIDRLSNHTDWSGAFEGIDTIIHLAGLAHENGVSDTYFNEVNVEGTLHLARQAAKAGVRRFVLVSSIGVNGINTFDKPFTSKSPPCNSNGYTRSKLAAEIGLQKISIEVGLELVIVRPTLVYGPDAPGNFGALTALINKLPLLPFGLTVNKRDFISVNNLADLLLTCASHPNAAGHTFLASDRETVSIREFTNAIAAGLNRKLVQIPVPVCFIRLVARLTGKSAMAEQLLGNLQVDSSNAFEVLGWTPPYTMEQAMAALSENKK
jgi:nucleoside-diphosphate-sugar epimerase